MSIEKTYQTLYENKLKEAEWYKKPASRNALLYAGLASFITLAALSSLSASALFSNSLLREGALHLLTNDGIAICTGVGFASAFGIGVGLLVYKKKSNFDFIDYISEKQGTIYSVKKDNKVVATLYGTPPTILPHAFIGNVIDLRGSQSNSSQLKKNKDIIPLESAEELTFLIIDYTEALNQERKEVKPSFEAAKLYGKYGLAAWEKGDEEAVKFFGIKNFTALLPQIKSGEKDIIDFSQCSSTFCSALQNVHGERNTNWMDQLKTSMDQYENPLFRIGALHLYDFDFNGKQSLGLITLFQNEGYQVERLIL